MITFIVVINAWVVWTSHAAIQYKSLRSDLNCKLTEQGKEYLGKLREARNGERCLLWSSNATFYRQADNPGDLKSNFCRYPTINNHTDMPNEPWCFTENGPEYCNVSLCSAVSNQLQVTRDCLLGNGFMTYAGQTTYPNRCMSWSADAVQERGYELWMFPGSSSWKELSNYCRNPDNDGSVWCYNREVFNETGVLEKIHCPVNSTCSKDCRLTEESLEYVGSKVISETRKPCLKAQDMIPSIFKSPEARKVWFESRYVNDAYEIDLFSCRSYPEQVQFGVNEMGPVCYVNDTETGDIVEESCAIHYCPPAGYNYTFEDTTAFSLFGLITTPASSDDSTPAVVGDAWKVLASASSLSHSNVDSPEGPYIGGAMWAFTAVFFGLLIMLDCSSIKSCTNRCKRNTSQVFERTKDLYGSRISLRSNQVGPCDSDVQPK